MPVVSFSISGRKKSLSWHPLTYEKTKVVRYEDNVFLVNLSQFHESNHPFQNRRVDDVKNNIFSIVHQKHVIPFISLINQHFKLYPIEWIGKKNSKQNLCINRSLLMSRTSFFPLSFCLIRFFHRLINQFWTLYCIKGACVLIF